MVEMLDNIVFVGGLCWVGCWFEPPCVKQFSLMIVQGGRLYAGRELVYCAVIKRELVVGDVGVAGGWPRSEERRVGKECPV